MTFYYSEANKNNFSELFYEVLLTNEKHIPQSLAF